MTSGRKRKNGAGKVEAGLVQAVFKIKSICN
jgi:hypothetical protein